MGTRGARGAPGTSGTRRNSKAPARSGAGIDGRGTTAARAEVASTQFARRARGATAGVRARGGRAVFASSAPKASESGGERSRGASGDNGFQPAARSSVFAAEDAEAQQGNWARSVMAGLVVLGLGLVGLVGTASVLVLRRQRAVAKATGGTGSGTTEM